MTTFVIGINHKTAPIEIREQFYLSEIERELFLSELKCNPSIVEAFVISTCNRTEVYFNSITTANLDPFNVIDHIIRIKKGDSTVKFQKYFYYLKNEQALIHLFEVTTGLDSLVLGEKQILGQVKKSFELSKQKGILSRQFNILANVVIKAGKKAHTETNISYGGSSISWAAINKAEKHLGDLSQKSVLIIGAGKMSKLAVGQIANRGFKKLYLMNRTQENALRIANQYNAEVVSFCDMKEILAKIDLCVCSISAPHYIIHKDTIEKVMPLRNQKMLMLIDISMPRNIDPQISEIENIKLYSIDDLDTVVEQTMTMRKESLKEVKTIIDNKLNDYYRKIQKIQELHEGEFSQAI